MAPAMPIWHPWFVMTMPSCSAQVASGSTTSARAMTVGVMNISLATVNSIFMRASCQRFGCAEHVGDSRFVESNQAIFNS